MTIPAEMGRQVAAEHYVAAMAALSRVNFAFFRNIGNG